MFDYYTLCQFSKRENSYKLLFMKKYWVYILCSCPHGTLYVGVTNNLARRVFEHKNHLIEGFTKRYKVTQLVYVETYDQILEALQREKRLKKWNRQWKIDLIKKHNPQWKDLYEDF